MSPLTEIDQWLRENKNILENKSLKEIARMALETGYSYKDVAEFVMHLSREPEKKISKADLEFIKFERQFLIDNLDK